MDPTEILKKPYARMVLPDSDGIFSAEIVEFSGCIAEGATAAEALENLEEVAADWIAAVIDQGQDIPEPMDAAGYSGKLVLRMPKSLHKKATLCAERDGASLNQFIVTCVAESVGTRARAWTAPSAQMVVITSTHTTQSPHSQPVYIRAGGFMTHHTVTLGADAALNQNMFLPAMEKTYAGS